MYLSLYKLLWAEHGRRSTADTFRIRETSVNRVQSGTQRRRQRDRRERYAVVSRGSCTCLLQHHKDTPHYTPREHTHTRRYDCLTWTSPAFQLLRHRRVFVWVLERLLCVLCLHGEYVGDYVWTHVKNVLSYVSVLRNEELCALQRRLFRCFSVAARSNRMRTRPCL